MTLIQTVDGRRLFVTLTPEQVETVKAQGGPLFLADGEPVLELREGPAMRTIAGELADVQPLVMREAKR